MALPRHLVINFFIKNTFITIVDPGAQEMGGEEARTRRSRSAPPRVCSPSLSDTDMEGHSSVECTTDAGAAEDEAVDECTAYFVGYTSMRERPER